MAAFDASRPCLILAPHLVFPARNGSDISLDRIGRHLSSHVPYVDLVGERFVVRYEGGRETGREPFANTLRTKVGAALRTVALRSHFYLEKFVTPAYARVARRYLLDPAYGAVLCSYITTTRLVTETPGLPDGRCYAVWSHNDEFKWFQDLQAAANPFTRLAARASERWLHRFFREHRRQFLFLHVTEADREGFGRYYPDHPSAIIPIGVDLPPEGVPALPPGAPAIRLLFLGSLGVKINHDALRHFGAHYAPVLRERLGERLEVLVVGSRPSKGVAELCAEHGWQLHADVTDEALEALYRSAMFAILPFAYATGAKLKLLNALAHGVPFLATTSIRAQADACVYPSLIADAPTDWLARIEAVHRAGIGDAERAALRSVAERHAWAASARRVYEALAAHTPEPQPG